MIIASDRAPTVAETGAEALFTCDRADVVRGWTCGAEALLGYGASDIVGRPVAVLVPPERIETGELARLREDVDARGGVRYFDTERLAKDGRRVRVTVSRSVLFDDAGEVRGYCCVLRHAGVTYASLDQLYDAEKLAALRAMAAGVAHEIGNPVAGALGLLQLAERKTGEPETRRRLAHARTELLRVAGITRELTDCTRAGRDDAAIDVNAAIKSAVVFARYAYPSATVDVRLMLDPDVPSLSGSRALLLDACLHLLMNGYEAIGGAGGILTVSSLWRDRAVVLRFEDTGSGMVPEVHARIFEPYFTTKPPGAAGLGLFVCRRIVVEEFHGTIEVDSKPSAGTRVCVMLPVDRLPARVDPSGVSRRAPRRRA
jgi:PAS domain S-box-containing protein